MSEGEICHKYKISANCTDECVAFGGDLV